MLRKNLGGGPSWNYSDSGGRGCECQMYVCLYALIGFGSRERGSWRNSILEGRCIQNFFHSSPSHTFKWNSPNETHLLMMLNMCISTVNFITVYMAFILGRVHSSPHDVIKLKLLFNWPCWWKCRMYNSISWITCGKTLCDTHKLSLCTQLHSAIMPYYSISH